MFNRLQSCFQLELFWKKSYWPPTFQWPGSAFSAPVAGVQQELTLVFLAGSFNTKIVNLFRLKELKSFGRANVLQCSIPVGRGTVASTYYQHKIQLTEREAFQSTQQLNQRTNCETPTKEQDTQQAQRFKFLSAPRQIFFSTAKDSRKTVRIGAKTGEFLLYTVELQKKFNLNRKKFNLNSIQLNSIQCSIRPWTEPALLHYRSCTWGRLFVVNFLPFFPRPE